VVSDSEVGAGVRGDVLYQFARFGAVVRPAWTAAVTSVAEQWLLRGRPAPGPGHAVLTAPSRIRQVLVARFGGIPLRRQGKATLADRRPVRLDCPDKEPLIRLLADRCEVCGDRGELQVHHVARLADLTRPGTGQPLWDAIMSDRRRKTLVVCATCHDRLARDYETLSAGTPSTVDISV
jgi:hypothetical protein